MSRPTIALLCAAVLAACAPSSDVVVPAEYRSAVRKAGNECAGISPKLIAAQLEQESGWDPRAVSRQGARGIAQFMPDTWDSWGQDLDGDGKANPFDPVEAIDAQGRLMCHLHEVAVTSGLDRSPEVLALAAYNAGWGPVQEHNGVPPFPETQAYVAAIRDMTPSVRFR